MCVQCMQYINILYKLKVKDFNFEIINFSAKLKDNLYTYRVNYKNNFLNILFFLKKVPYC